MSSSNLGQNQRFLYLKKQQPFLGLCVHAQSGPTLCHPMGCSLLGSSVCGIFQARILEGVAISYSRESSQLRSNPLESPALQVGSFNTEPPVDSLCWISYNGRGFLSSSQPLLTTLVIMLKGSINLSLKIYKTTSQEQN